MIRHEGIEGWAGRRVAPRHTPLGNAAERRREAQISRWIEQRRNVSGIDNECRNDAGYSIRAIVLVETRMLNYDFNYRSMDVSPDPSNVNVFFVR